MGTDLAECSMSFQKAIDVFKNKSDLSTKQLTDMQMTSLPDLQSALAEMQSKQRSSRTMRYLKRLQPFLDAMEQYSSVINIFANTSDIVAFIWVGLRPEVNNRIPTHAR